MGKNIKSYATTQVHFPGKGREALWQTVPNPSLKIWYGLTVHTIHFKSPNISFKTWYGLTVHIIRS